MFGKVAGFLCVEKLRDFSRSLTFCVKRLLSKKKFFLLKTGFFWWKTVFLWKHFFGEQVFLVILCLAIFFLMKIFCCQNLFLGNFCHYCHYCHYCRYCHYCNYCLIGRYDGIFKLPFNTLKVTFSQTLRTIGPTDGQLDF